jgi:hypothetical protein
MFMRHALSVAIACTILFTISKATAQRTWTRIDSIFGPLPSSIHLYRTEDTLNSRPFIAYYLSAELRDKKIIFNSDTGRNTAKGYYEKKHNPLVVVNGAFFNPQTYQNLSVIISRGRMLSYNIYCPEKLTIGLLLLYPTRSALGISKKRKPDVAWLFTDMDRRWPYGFQKNPIVARGKRTNPILSDLNTLDDWKPWRMRTAIGGGPVLIQHGQVRITNQEEQVYLGDKLELNSRTAMGYTKDNRLIILVIEGRNPRIAEGATLTETASLLQSCHVLKLSILTTAKTASCLSMGRKLLKLLIQPCNRLSLLYFYWKERKLKSEGIKYNV